MTGTRSIARRLASEDDLRQQLALFERAFAEDNVMIEAQQRVIARTPQPRMLWIRATERRTGSAGCWTN